MKQQGTGIIVLYNLWEDDQGQLELDFDADQYDSQIRGANLDEKTIMLALHYPNSMHYLTYRTLYGVLEFNFVQPAHDKQGIECTTVLAHQESRFAADAEAVLWGVTTRRWVCTPSRIGTRRVASDGGVLLTYREHSITKSHDDDVEPTAAILRIGSLSRTAGEQTLLTGFSDPAPTSAPSKKSPFGDFRMG
ncbi:unnamed protein product [Sphagnum balticum]